jgi:DNA-3-methyladenine glycosylase I
MVTRCEWVENYYHKGEISELMLNYHDHEWGYPLHDDRALFELLCLETYQAGLSWETVLNKRENFRKAFSNYEIEAVADFGDEDLSKLLSDVSIIRNRLKLEATIHNAKRVLEVQAEFGTFDAFVWSFVNQQSIDDHIAKMTDIPFQTALSQTMAKDMKKRGFKFTGPSVIYSFMQASGMVNDHEVTCDFNPDKA